MKIAGGLGRGLIDLRVVSAARRRLGLGWIGRCKDRIPGVVGLLYGILATSNIYRSSLKRLVPNGVRKSK